MKALNGLIIFVALLVCSCKKEGFITSPDAQISFSADTLYYDTVFTSVGSVTKFVRIFNNNDQKLLLSAVELAGGASSPFRINVDGIAGNASGIEILPNDSLYVFVSVQVNPNTQNLPFILRDSLRVSYNGNEKFVQLQAWGQNAVFLKNYTVTGNETWTNEKPFVILDRLLVDKNAKLTIGKGTKLYFHADAPLLVDGTLHVKGEKADSLKVSFQGDRLDLPYREYPGSWPGIYLQAPSHDNILEFAEIKNAYQGLVVDQPAANGLPKLVLNESVIQNCFDAGLIAIRTEIRSRNTLITNCGKNMIIAFGGKYEFTHLTSAAYSNLYITHKDPVLSITNVFEDPSAIFTADLNASFVNCIFWGDEGLVKDEVVVRKEGNAAFSVNFANSLWRMSGVPANITSSAMINNQDPMFTLVDNDKIQYNFRLKENSPAIGKGKPAGVTTDLDGKPRKPVPDMGAYERP
ncbi:choice-of-anchor Q domain-containing protein [Flavitalea antarctica]